MRPLELRRHRLLRLEVVAADGTSVTSYRAFCTRRRASVELATCSTCVHCKEIDRDVVCAVPTNDQLDPHGHDTPVGVALGDGALVVHASISLRDAKKLMHSEGRALVAVVDDDNALVGVLCDEPDSASEQRPASLAMHSPVSVTETTPVRTALKVLAATHLREIPVITADGRPLGVFRDVEGLRWLISAKTI